MTRDNLMSLILVLIGAGVRLMTSSQMTGLDFKGLSRSSFSLDVNSSQ